MKLECNKDSLLSAVSKAEKVTGKNLTLPVLSCILFEAEKDSLVLKATNLDLGIEIKIPAKVDRPGRFTMKGGVILSFLSNLTGDKKVYIDLMEGSVSLRSESAQASIKIVPSEDFPSIPTFNKETTVLISGLALADGFRAVHYSASTSHVKPELASVLVWGDGSDLIFAATDSFRLAEKKIRIKKPKEVPQTIIPLKNILEIVKVFEEAGPNEGEVSFSKNQVSFTFGGVYLISRTIEGSFPDYKQIIPKKHSTEAIILREDFARALKLSTVFSDSFNQITFSINPAKKKMEVISKNNEVGNGTVAIPSAISGDELDISFNHRYLSDCLGAVKADSLVFSMGNGNTPAIIRGVSDPSFTYLVMPMNR